jgi:hypothetical protein
LPGKFVSAGVNKNIIGHLTQYNLKSNKRNHTYVNFTKI